MMGRSSTHAPRSSTDLRGSLLADLADVHVRARRVVDVVDGDVGEAVLGPGLEPMLESSDWPAEFFGVRRARSDARALAACVG